MYREFPGSEAGSRWEGLLRRNFNSCSAFGAHVLVHMITYPPIEYDYSVGSHFVLNSGRSLF